MGASKDLDITLHPKTDAHYEEQLREQVWRYDEYRKNMEVTKLIHLGGELRRQVRMLENWIDSNPEIAAEFHKTVRNLAQEEAGRLHNLARSLDPAEQTEPEELPTPFGLTFPPFPSIPHSHD